MARAAKRSHVLAVLAVVAVLVVPSRPALAHWPARADHALVLSPEGASAELLDGCADGSGGCYVLWRTTAAGASAVVQHLNARGDALLPAGGLPLASSLGSGLKVVADGAGGAIVLTLGYSSADGSSLVQATRIDARGGLQWTTPLGRAPGGSTVAFAHLVAEVSGTEFSAAWRVTAAGSVRLLMQRLDGSGHALWGDSAITVTTGSSIGEVGPLIPDARGGDWVVEAGANDPQGSGHFLHVQHVGADGALAWPDPGSAGFGATSAFLLGMAEDGAGGVYVGWNQPSANPPARLQRIRADGSLGFAAAGLPPPEPAFESPMYPVMAPAPGARAFLAWFGYPGGPPYVTGVQEVDSMGSWGWPAPYVMASPAKQSRDACAIFANTDGGATLFVGSTSNDLISAQRFSATGQRLWGDAAPVIMSVPNGLTHYDWQGGVWRYVPNGDGGATFMLADLRGGYPATFQVRVQHLDAHGRLGDTVPAILGLEDVPADLGGWLRVRWRASSLQGDSAMATTHYEVLRRQASTQGVWTESVVADLPATSDTEYVAVVPTLGDSLSPVSRPTILCVRALDATGRTWDSLPDSAFSSANSPPLAVESLPGVFVLDVPAPSPTSGRTRIGYRLPTGAQVELTIYDLSGRAVRQLVRGERSAGPHTETLELARSGELSLTPGLYFIRLAALDRVLARRLLVVR